MKDARLNDLFSRYYGRCLLYAKSYVFDAAEAESIVNDAFCLLWQKDGAVEDPVPFLFATIRNKSLNCLRGRYRRMKMLENASAASLREMEIRISGLESCDPHSLYDSEISEIMENTLSSLPPKTAGIFRMSRYEGLSYADISARSGIGLKAVEYHVGIALRALREALKDYIG